jgi:YggT family protein
MNLLNPFFYVLNMALHLYMWAVIISAIMSWLVHFGVVNTRNQAVQAIGRFLWRITEPALKPIRRILPNLGGIDISPIVLILAIVFVQRMLFEIQYSIAVAG